MEKKVDKRCWKSSKSHELEDKGGRRSEIKSHYTVSVQTFVFKLQ